MRASFRYNTFGDENLVSALEACCDWANAYIAKEAPRWITILGTSGGGKTHLANHLWKIAESISRNVEHRSWDRCQYPPRPIYWPEFVQKLRRGSSWEMRDNMNRWPVLFLDDIGADRDKSGFGVDELNTLLGCRMGKWTIITGNVSSAEVAAMDQRISSRMIRDNNVLVQITTMDYALRPKA